MAGKQISVDILLKLLNDKRVQQAIRGISKDVKELAQTNQVLSTSEEQVARFAKGESAAIYSLKSNLKSLTGATNVVTTSTNKATGQIKRVTESYVKSRRAIVRTTAAQEKLNGVWVTTKQHSVAIARGWKTTSQVMGQHGKVLQRTQTSMKLVNGEMVKVSRRQEHVKKGWKTMGQGATSLNMKMKNVLKMFTMARWMLVNLAMAGALVYGVFRTLVAPAIELESEMANVRKTTSFTAEETKKLRYDLIDLSKELPIAAKELAQIATVAGQLGIATRGGSKAILNFTKTVAMMTIATEMTAEDAAKNLAKISQAFKLPISSVNQLGSIINELSNTTAATSTEIVDAMTRIGAAAANLGISAEFAAALGATLISAGLKATRAGTLIRRTLQEIVASMDEIIKIIPGMDIDEFRKMLEEDANGALLLVIKSLKEYGKTADVQAKVMDIFGKRAGFAMLSLISNSEELTRNIEIANNEWEIGLSLLKETSIQMGTTANQWKLLTNDIKAATLTHEGWINSLIKGTRTGILIRQLRKDPEIAEELKKQEKYQKPESTWDFIKGGRWATYGAPAGVASDIEVHKAGLEILKRKLRDVYGPETYQLIEDIINQHDDLQDKYDVGALALDMISSHYSTLANEMGITLDSLDEENKTLAKGSDEWNKYKELIKDANEQYSTTLELSPKIIEDLKELDSVLSGIEPEFPELGELAEFGYTLAAALDKIAGHVEEPLAGIESLIVKFKEFFEPDITSFDILRTQIEDVDVELISLTSSLDEQLKVWGTNKQELLEYVDALEKLEEVSKKAKEISASYSIFANNISKELKDLKEIYNEYASARFVGETSQLANIHEIEMAIKREQLAQLKLNDAVDVTNDTLKSQQDEYKAWVDTLHETIRALIEEGNLTAENVSDVVKAQQTKLLATSKFNDEQKKETTVIDELQNKRNIAQLEYELGIGEQRYQLGEYIYELEHRGEVELTTAQATIIAMENVKNQIDTMTEKQKDIEERWQMAQLENALYALGVENATDFINASIESQILILSDLIDEYDDLRQAANDAAAAQVRVHGGGTSQLQSDLEALAGDLVQSTLGIYTDGVKQGELNFNLHDFISRPGQPAQSFSPDDTIIGVKNTGDIGGGTTISIGEINISGVSGDADDFAREFTEAIQRELRTR